MTTWILRIVLAVWLALPMAFGQFTELESNDSKASANLVPMLAPGGFLTGTSTASSGAGLDYFLVQTAPALPGIYEHTLTLTSPTAGHTATLRGRNQAGGLIDPLSDSIVQSSPTSGTRLNRWYGFGTGASIYYRVTGLSSTPGPYTSTLSTVPVTPVDAGSFTAGAFTIASASPFSFTNTDLWVYDASFSAMPGFGNDDDPAGGGNSRSVLNRSFAAGVYYVAVAPFNLANSEASPVDDVFRSGFVLDAPGVVATSSATVGFDLSLTITGPSGTVTVPLSTTAAYQVRWVKFTVTAPAGDLDPPSVTIDTPADGAVVGNASVFVSATVTDASATTVTSTPSGVAGSLAAFGGTLTGTVVLPAEGPNSITVSATDSASNVGGTTITVTLDTTPPAVIISSPDEGTVVSTTPLAFVVSVLDATATTVTIGATSATVPAGGGNATIPVPLVEGFNAVTVVVVDAGGNPQTVVRNVILDTAAPEVSIGSPLNGASYGVGESPITVLATIDDVSGTSYASTPSGLSGTTGPGAVGVTGPVALAEGSNTIEVTATDALGRSASASVVVILDTTAPDIVIESPSAGAPVRGVVDFHATVEDVLPGTGVASVTLLVDGAPQASFTSGPYETSFDTTTVSDGLHTFSVVATDGEGNTATGSLAALVDNTAPTIDIVLPVVSAFISGNALFVAQAADGGSLLGSVTMLAGGAPPSTDGSTNYVTPVSSATVTSSILTTAFLDGPLVLSATAVDAAGNSTTASITVNVDNLAPASSLVTPTDGSDVNGIFAVTAASSAGDLASLAIFIDGVLLGSSATSPFTVMVDSATSLDGTIEITVVATDLAANSSTTTATVTVDRIRFHLVPSILNLRARCAESHVTARLEGASLGSLLPTQAHSIELRVPGGSPVPAQTGWSGDNALSDPDHDGIPNLNIRFERKALIASIRAGIAAHLIHPCGRVRVTIVADGGRVLGSDLIWILGH